MDLRDYGLGAQILFDLGVRQFRFLTNNPKKVIGLEGYGIQMIEQVPIRSPANPHNEKYLESKKQKMGHLLLSILLIIFACRTLFFLSSATSRPIAPLPSSTVHNARHMCMTCLL